MATTNPSLPPKNIRPVDRFITTHDSEGKAVFSKKVDESLEFKTVSDDAQFGLGYVTDQFPVDFGKEKDVQTYEHFLANPPRLVVPGGSVVRFVDMPPGLISPMHRTTSLDYGVLLEGEIELILDSGEKKLMKRGDVSIQRGTMHLWREPPSRGTH